VSRPQRGRLLPAVPSNCRLTLPGRGTGKRIKPGRDALIRLRLSARPLVWQETLRSRTRSLLLLIRERSVSACGGMPPTSPLSQLTIPMERKVLWIGRRRRRGRDSNGLPHYRRQELASARRLHRTSIFTQRMTTQPFIIRIRIQPSGEGTSSPAVRPRCCRGTLLTGRKY
jgi:hypothetical protein